MDNNDIKNYIQRLKDIEQELTKENGDLTFVNDLNKILGELNYEVKEHVNPLTPHLEVKCKRLSENAVIPTYAKDGDAGLDLTVTTISSNTTFDVTYKFGISLEIPKGYVGLLFPRSSVRNFELFLSNCVGVIDSGYRGEIEVTFKKTNGLDSHSYKVGERVAQLIIIPYPQIKMVESDELSTTERGDGGYGSTGL
jgi:dUTP pyrophosphatase